MLFNKYRIRNIMDNTYISFIDVRNIRETDVAKRAVSYNKKQASAIIAKLQSNLEFVKYKLETV